jgi:hypothetical protein
MAQLEPIDQFEFPPASIAQAYAIVEIVGGNRGTENKKQQPGVSRNTQQQICLEAEEHRAGCGKKCMRNQEAEKSGNQIISRV